MHKTVFQLRQRLCRDHEPIRPRPFERLSRLAALAGRGGVIAHRQAGLGARAVGVLIADAATHRACTSSVRTFVRADRAVHAIAGAAHAVTRFTDVGNAAAEREHCKQEPKPSLANRCLHGRTVAEGALGRPSHLRTAQMPHEGRPVRAVGVRFVVKRFGGRLWDTVALHGLSRSSPSGSRAALRDDELLRVGAVQIDGRCSRHGCS